MAEKQLKYVATGEDRSASRTFGSVADKAESSGMRIGSAFKKAGSVIGGEFGELLTKAGESIDSVGEKGKGLGGKLEIGGAGVLALGATLTAFGSKRKADEAQLRAAIEASGHSYEDYEKQIGQTVKAQEKFGHGESDTERALQRLTAATNDPAIALKNMSLVADLAAAKHESLASAADQVAKVYGGSGKVLKQFGITLESAKALTVSVEKATTAHKTAVSDLSTAQTKLNELMTVDASKTQLSVSQQISLRKAHEAVTLAIKQHGAGSKEASAAEQSLADKLAIMTDHSRLSTAQQLALKKAHDDVAAAEKKVAATTKELGAAQAASKTQTQTADDALTQLSGKLKGQASAAADTWTGKLNAAQSQLADFASKMGQKYGPAVTILGGTFTTAGMMIGKFKDHQAAAALKASEMAAAQEASAARVQAAAIEVEAAEAQVAEAANLSATEQVAAQERVIAAHATMAAEVTAADEAAGRASTLALGPVGIAIGAVIGVGALAAGALHLFGSKAHEAVKPTTEFTDAILSDNDALGMNTRKLTENRLQKDGLYDAGLRLGITQKTLTDSAMGNAAAMKSVSAATHLANMAYDDNYKAIVAADRAAGIDRTTAARQKMAYDDMTAAQKAAYNAGQKLSGGLAGVTSSMVASKRAADNITAADEKATGSLTKFQQAAAKKIAARLEAVDHVSPKVAQARARMLALNGATVTTYLDIEERLRSNAAASSAHRTGGGALYAKLTAGGSDFYDGGVTSLAEREPELVTKPGYANLPRGSKVMPLSRMHGGGGPTVSLTVHAPQIWAGSTEALGRFLFGLIEDRLQSGAGIKGLTY